MGTMRRFIRDHSLSIVALGAFLVIWLGGQAWSGHRAFNEEQRAHGEATVSFGEYLTRADFGEATFENWESEFLQMGVYVLLTAWLVQKGSAESKPADGDPRLDADPREHRDDPEAPWRTCVQRRAGRARRTNRLAARLLVQITLLVRVAAELAVGVPRRGHPRRVQRVPPATRFARVEARPRTPRLHGRRLKVARTIVRSVPAGAAAAGMRAGGTVVCPV
jgi:hypothetical protein